VTVDLNAEKGKKSTEKNTFNVSVRFTKLVNFTALGHWLHNQTNFTNECIEALSFLDHLMREWPSQRYTVVRKSFFSRGEKRYELSTIRAGMPSGVEAMKGVFSSIRAVHTASGPSLSINVDVANCTFYCDGPLTEIARRFLGVATIADMSAEYIKAAKPYQNNRESDQKWRNSRMYQVFKRLRKVKISYVHHKPKDGQKPEEYMIETILQKDPTEHKFSQEQKDPQGNVISKKEVTVAAYFKQKYGWTAQHVLPLVKTTKGDIIPMAVCMILPNQRYPFKLDEMQTSDMIKFAVTHPGVRWQSIEAGLGMLNWSGDAYLKNYGLQISSKPAEVKGRLLSPPTVQFRPVKDWDPKIKAAVAASKEPRSRGPQDNVPGNRAQSGRWDLMGMQFILPNKTPLKSWGVMVINDGRAPCINQHTANTFFQLFATAYRNHGGNIVNTTPHIMVGNTKDGGEMISYLWNAVGQKTGWPQLLVFVVPTKNADLYKRIKKSCDCRYGVPSQVLNAKQVEKMSGQYISNVLMKVNAKLGGATSKAVGSILPKLNPKLGKMEQLTAIIGADVSHAAPGSDAGSMAAITLSMDQLFTRYNARCNTNGHRVEMITTKNIDEGLKPMLEQWMAGHGGRLPNRVLYLRDGVSEGQYGHVLDQEVRDMKGLCLQLNPKVKTNFTVVIAAKRHHIRFFPAQGDKNGNPKPGTMVEVGCTHPYEFDWYLCAHSAIKGTARPIHYHVLINEEEQFGTEELQQLIFEHSFQYCRSTTPVSQHPAVYYAHLASNRATAHLNQAAVSSGKKEQQKDAGKGSQAGGSQVSGKGKDSSSKEPTEIPPLLPLNEKLGLQNVMWYV
jgi:eukaryotic translation initiation factor 2C